MLSMAEGNTPLFRDHWFQYGRIMNSKDHGEVINEGHDISRSSSASSFEASTLSDESSLSIDTTDDASSSLSSTNSNERLYDLSELMAELPIKRGLSKYYQGKSESFTCLARVKSIDDLAKKVTPYRRKMKTSKSYGGLHTYKSYTLPTRIISKKGSKGSLSSSSPTSKSRPPLIPLQKN